MKFYKGQLVSYLMDGEKDETVRMVAEIIIPAKDRTEALRTACEMGQAMARGQNYYSGDYALSYCVHGVEEIPCP